MLWMKIQAARPIHGQKVVLVMLLLMLLTTIPLLLKVMCSELVRVRLTHLSVNQPWCFSRMLPSLTVRLKVTSMVAAN